MHGSRFDPKLIRTRFPLPNDECRPGMHKFVVSMRLACLHKSVCSNDADAHRRHGRQHIIVSLRLAHCTMHCHTAVALPASMHAQAREQQRQVVLDRACRACRIPLQTNQRADAYVAINTSTTVCEAMQAVSVDELINGNFRNNTAGRLIMRDIYWDLAKRSNYFDKALFKNTSSTTSIFERADELKAQAKPPAWIYTNVNKRHELMRALQRKIRTYPPLVSTIERRAIDNSSIYVK